MPQKHTTTPWHLHIEKAGGVWYYQIRSRCGHRDYHVADSNAHFEGRGIQNAAFIVRAANCHDELVAACKALVERYPATAPISEGLMKVVTMAAHALTKATEGT